MIGLLRHSLNTRLLLASGIVLAAFMGLTGLTLDQLFRNSVEQAIQERLNAQLYLLIAATNLSGGGDEGVTLPYASPHVRISDPNSGLYAQIVNNSGKRVWHSPSMAGLEIPPRWGLASTDRAFERVTASNGQQLFAFSFGITPDDSFGYTFTVAENLDSYNTQVHDFRRNLWGWLGGVAVLLLLVQSTILRWGLAPLRRAAQDLSAIETGHQQQLEGDYPNELRGLTDNINALIRSEREHLERYRNTLGDLAHSLKTPLAVLRGSIERSTPRKQLRVTVEEQVQRMSEIVEYQLIRAATSGRTALTSPVAIAAVVAKISNALAKVYADKKISCSVNIPADAVFLGDEGDLMEVLGNLLDNAHKWCRQRVVVAVECAHSDTSRCDNLTIRIWDDGPGIPEALRHKVLQRGARVDDSIDGHGIGLAVVASIVGLYGGEMEIDDGPLCGTQISLHLPGGRLD
ncbi:MAG: GHKL domain-containing protein [Gammaproteobacteria bacterium]|nr:GHKL domain-containing protein [Gammaproteobacteria bacterium]